MSGRRVSSGWGFALLPGAGGSSFISGKGSMSLRTARETREAMLSVRTLSIGRSFLVGSMPLLRSWANGDFFLRVAPFS